MSKGKRCIKNTRQVSRSTEGEVTVRQEIRCRDSELEGLMGLSGGRTSWENDVWRQKTRTSSVCSGSCTWCSTAGVLGRGGRVKDG